MPDTADVDLTVPLPPVCSTLGGMGGDRRRVRFWKRIMPVWLIGRRATLETQAFDEYMVAGGNLKCGGANPFVEVADGRLDPGTYGIGDYVWLYSPTAAGNANAELDGPVIVPIPVDELWQLLELHAAWARNATVADRNCYVTIYQGLTPYPPVAAGLMDWQSVPVVLSANQEGKLTMPANGLNVAYNDDGTVTVGAVNPLPLYFSIEGFNILSFITGGEVTDTHALAALVRRVA